jgi:hypothetical protein
VGETFNQNKFLFPNNIKVPTGPCYRHQPVLSTFLDFSSFKAVYAVWTALFVGAVALAMDYARMLRLRAKMPPGPLPLPIIGNVLQLPKCKPWYRFEEWGNRFESPIITVWFGRNPTVVLNDAWTASDLMDKRANIYSSRPSFVIPGVLMDGEKNNQTMLPYGDRWRLHRKLTVT